MEFMKSNTIIIIITFIIIAPPTILTIGKYTTKNHCRLARGICDVERSETSQNDRLIEILRYAQDDRGS